MFEKLEHLGKILGRIMPKRKEYMTYEIKSTGDTIALPWDATDAEVVHELKALGFLPRSIPVAAVEISGDAGYELTVKVESTGTNFKMTRQSDV